MRRLILFSIMLSAVGLRGWIDYDDAVEPRDATFGKPFRGFALKLETTEVDFEQEHGVVLRVVLRNTSDETAIMQKETGRMHALKIVLATQQEHTFVSRNLLELHPDNAVSSDRIPPRGAVTVLEMPFDDLRVAAFRDYRHGIPLVEDGARRLSAASLVPRIYLLRAILYSRVDDARPDFAAASESWPILLRAKRGERMSEEERTRKMTAWLRQMSTGAYGGVGVSSQLAALGDVAVDPLIEMAEKRGADERGNPADQAVRESRIWAIVTLCNTGSERAEEYILKTLRDPVSFGDLAFIAWHSQGFASERVTRELRRFAEDAARGRPMPWEIKHGPESRRHARGSLEYIFKHFISVGESITHPTMSAVIDMQDPKLIAFGLMAWQPADVRSAAGMTASLFTGGRSHGNVKRAVLSCLTTAAGDAGFPVYSRDEDVNAQWLQACLWLHRAECLDRDALQAALRWLVLDVPREAEAVQAGLIAALAQVGGEHYPVDTVRPVLPRDWVTTWQWALRTSGIETSEAISFCTAKMRTRDELPAAVKEGLLSELQRLIGRDFPLTSSAPEQLGEAWLACGRWLVENGYFETKGQ